MSRLSDLLNPLPSSTAQSQKVEISGDGGGQSKSHHRNQSITSPLEALAIAATTSFAEPSLTNAANPPTFLPNPNQHRHSSYHLSQTTHNHPYLQQPNDSPAQPVSYSLYNQPEPPNAHTQLDTDSSFDKKLASSGFRDSDKLETSQDPVNPPQVEETSVRDMEKIAQPPPVAALKKEKSKSENALLRNEGVKQSIEDQLASEDSKLSKENATSAVKQEASTPTMAKSPATAPSPKAPVNKGPKSRTTQKSEKNKENTKPAKKPTARKRKMEVDSRGVTPLSHRSGTPNSSKPLASRNTKQSSATPAHSSPPAVEDEGEDDDEGDSENELFCICRKPDDHTWMIGCDGGCEDWFHGRCVNMDQSDEELIDKFICPNCTANKAIQTTWKPMCRLEGCRNPARAGGPHPSKYCCDQHGIEFMHRAVVNRASKSAAADTPARKRRRENYTDHIGNEDEQEPPHLRGGYLLPGEIKSLLSSVDDIKQFKRLGDAISASSDATLGKEANDQNQPSPAFSNQETERLEEISNRKMQLAHELGSFDDREQFHTMIRARAKTVLDELKKKEKNTKDICGFDKRIRWSQEEFDEWRSSPAGQEALQNRILSAPATEIPDADGDTKMVEGATDNGEEIGHGVCQRKRCKQHDGWYKLETQNLAFERSDCRRAIQQLDLEEKGIRERAMIRSMESNQA